MPQHLGFELCQRIREIIVADETMYPYLDEAAATAVKGVREDLGRTLRAAAPNVEFDSAVDGAARWWTFAGGRINHTLKYGLEWIEPGWKVVADNFLVRCQGGEVNHARVLAAIRAMSKEGFWEREDTRRAILASVPEYRLSKFQSALPPWAAAEMVGVYFLDFEGTAGFLAGIDETAM